MRERQQWFDGAWERAKHQIPSATIGDTDQPKRCTYLPTDTTPGCFIGVTLTQDEKDCIALYELETSGLSTIEPRLRHLEDPSINPVDLLFLIKLQQIHDNHSPYKWEGLLREFAKEWFLSIPE